MDVIWNIETYAKWEVDYKEGCFYQPFPQGLKEKWEVSSKEHRFSSTLYKGWKKLLPHSEILQERQGNAKAYGLYDTCAIYSKPFSTFTTLVQNPWGIFSYKK